MFNNSFFGKNNKSNNSYNNSQNNVNKQNDSDLFSHNNTNKPIQIMMFYSNIMVHFEEDQKENLGEQEELILYYHK